MTDRPVIYLDGFATSPLAPEAAQAMADAWQWPTNAGSPHIYGERAAALLDRAKMRIAELVGADASEIILTSGATEADNLAVLGVCRKVRAQDHTRNRIAISAIEHKAVSEAAFHLEAEGFEVDVLPVTAEGLVDLDAAAAMIGRHTALVSTMLANNELGTIQPVQQLAQLAHEAGCFIHTDAAQAVGKIPIDVAALDIDYLSMSGHKVYGPAGCGALYIAAGTTVPLALQFGGGQQQGIRPGTVPVPLAVGFGIACELAQQRMERDADHATVLKDAFLHGIRKLPNTRIIAANAPALPGALSLSIEGINAEELVSLLFSTVSLSTGSACTSGNVEPSHVLKAIGLEAAATRSVIRFFFGRYNTADEVITAAEMIEQAAHTLRNPR